ncbi:MAG: class I SAM-dependent methyltransferase [Fibrobacterota bacterium]
MSPLKSRLCPFCQQPAGRLFNPSTPAPAGQEEAGTVWLCRPCGIAATHPWMSPEQLSEFYTDTYDCFTEKDGLTARLQQFVHERDLRRVLRHCRKPAPSLFEIGAGSGAFLACAQQQGLAVDGAEPSEPGRRCAEKRLGISLSSQPAESVTFRKRYDILVLRHALEHTLMPKECLMNILEHGLDPEGILYLKLPRLDSWEAERFGRHWSGLDVPRHRFHFTDAGIRKLLADTGYRNITIRSDIVPTDLLRSISSLALEKSGHRKQTLARMTGALPLPVRYLLAQTTALMMAPFHSGRMTVLAVRPCEENKTHEA